MVMFELALKLVLFLAPLAYSPGPGNLFFAANGARFGFAATIPANTGYHVATWIVTFAIGLGFGFVAESLPGFLFAIKYLGSAYVFYLAWLLFNARTLKEGEKPRHANFIDGILLLLMNPKAYLIILLIFTQFLQSSDQANIWLIIWISTVFTLNNLVAFSIWTALGDLLASAFRRKTQAKWLNMFFGAMLAAVAIWMLLD